MSYKAQKQVKIIKNARIRPPSSKLQALLVKKSFNPNSNTNKHVTLSQSQILHKRLEQVQPQQSK